MTDTSKDWRDVVNECISLRVQLAEALQNEQASAEAYWEARGQLTRANERIKKLRTFIAVTDCDCCERRTIAMLAKDSEDV